MTLAWKFLDERSRGVFSGFTWPTPSAPDTAGPWVESREVVACEHGVHACSADQLAWWMSAQLWQIELDAPIAVDDLKMVAKRGRLLHRVATWPDVGSQLAEWAVWRVRDHVVGVLSSEGSAAAGAELAAAASFQQVQSAAAAIDVDPASAAGVAIAQVSDSVDDISNPVFACWDAARAAGHRASAADRSIHSYKRAFAAERTLQSQWIAAQLGLGV